nr:hypothetical protein [uncultured Dysosmobacter sp.]
MFENTELYSRRYPQEDYEEFDEPRSEEEQAKTQTKLEEFKRKMQSIRYQEIPERMAKRQRFIDLALDLSETFHVDMDINQKDFGITVTLYMCCSFYPDIMTRMIAALFSMSDTSATFINHNQPGDFILSLDYKTHDGYIDGEKINVYG